MQRILVATDFSTTSSAAAYLGYAMAGAHHAQLCLYHATGLLDHASVKPEIAERVRETRAEHSHRDLVELRDQLREEDRAPAAVEIVIRHAEPAFGIRAYAREWEADLIVMGSHEDDRSFMLGSIAMQVARAAPCPVLVTREHHRARFPASGKFHRPLVAIDHSPFSAPAVELAAQLADGAATMELVHIYYSAEAPDHEGSIELARTEELARLSELVRDLDIAPVTVTSRATAGSVAKSLVALIADSHFDLVVAGAHGRRGAGPTLGTVADRLLRGSDAPVLILPETAL